MKKYIFILTLSILSHYSFSQTNLGSWRKTSADRVIPVKGKQAIKPQIFSVYQVDFQLLKNQLNEAPEQLEQSTNFKVSLPSPTGMKTFIIAKTNILPKHLQASDADIQTFFGYNEKATNEWITLDYTNHGFHAMVSGSIKGTKYFIDPYQMNDTENYRVYYKKNYSKNVNFECLLNEENLLGRVNGDEEEVINSQVKSAIQSDCKLRTYRLAIASSAEYATYHGGTQAFAQSGIVTSISRVNQIFRRDFGVVFTIVSGTNIVYTNPVSDPYINGDIYQMIDTNSYVIPDNVGILNYDIGHVFGTAGLLSGGLATRDGVCQPDDKAGGVTTFEDPIGDQFDIDFVAHELAHQLGARHTFNSLIGACSGYLQRSEIGAYEPGSGSTIMAYAGLCNQIGISTDVQDSSDVLFHAYSIAEITKSIITGNSSECGNISSTGNTKPISDAGPVFYHIPVNTPFQLTGNSTDIDASDVHTYSWEQYDLAPVSQNIPISTSTTQPNFRVFEPTLNKTRYFPNLDSLIENVNWPKYEMIPSVSRMMKFRLTVRDNSVTGCGCTDYDEIDINFDGSKGPFLVTYPNLTGISWTAATTKTITWAVAGTDSAPVSCSKVDIMLSTDGGYTYPHVLALNVPNDGSQVITVPNLSTTTARVKVICSDNIFFDISNNNFTIIPIPITEPEISFSTVLIETFEKSQPDGNLDCRPYTDYMVTMQIENAPIGNAIITINGGGNATDLYDYKIIGTPFTFLNGMTNDKSFTVRIIDDGEVDPLENLELTYTITGTTTAIYGSSNQTCLVKIHDDEHAPYSGEIPHYEENFESGLVFGSGVNNWNNSNNSGAESWVLGSGGDLSDSGKSLYISENGTSNGYNTSNSYNYVSIESSQINGVGKNNQVLTFDYVSEGDLGHDFGRLAYNSGTGVTIIEGGNYAPFVGVSTKKTAQIVLPANTNGNNFRLTWGWSNSVTNPGGVSGKSFEIDNIRVTEGTPGIRVETEITTVTDEQYLGPFQSIYYYDPNDGNLLLYIQNTSSHDYGCTSVEINRAGKGATEFQFVDVSLDVTDKSYKVIPTNNNPSGTYKLTLFYTEDEISGWESATGNSRANIQIVKTIGNISAVTPGNQQLTTTFYNPVTLGSFGNDITLTSTINNGFSGFAAGITTDILPIHLLHFDANAINNEVVSIDWITAREVDNDYFTVERSLNALDWEEVSIVNGAGNSSILLDYNLIDKNPLNGISYYRLKQTDFDGEYEYSEIKSVNIKAQITDVVLYPNPTSSKVILKGNPSELNEISIYNVLGQNITHIIQVNKFDDTTVILDFSELISGVYFVKTKTTVNKVSKI